MSAPAAPWTPEEVLKLRREKSAPVLAAFKRWVEDLLPGVPPQSALGKALAYTVKQWPKLVRHLEHRDVPAHNNYIENLIRPFSSGAARLALREQSVRCSRQRQSLLPRGHRSCQRPRALRVSELPVRKSPRRRDRRGPRGAAALERSQLAAGHPPRRLRPVSSPRPYAGALSRARTGMPEGFVHRGSSAG